MKKATMTKYFLSNQLRRSLLVIPKKKIRRLLLGVFVLSMICLFAMVIQIQEIQTFDAFHSRNNIASSLDSDLQHGLLPLPGKHRNLVARETLAVGDDDYQDLTAHHKKADLKAGTGAQTFQKGFQNGAKNAVYESQWNSSQLKTAEIKNPEQSHDSHPDQSFQKAADANGGVMFEIQNIKNREKNKKSVKFYNQAEQHGAKVDGLVPMGKEENVYSYNYDGWKEKEVLKNLKQVEHKEPSQFKFLSHNGEVPSILSGNKHDTLLERQQGTKNSTKSGNLSGNKEMHLAHVQPSQQENWPNSHQMRANNNDSEKPSQFVDGVAVLGGLKNINSNMPAGASIQRNEGTNLLQGIIGINGRDEVAKTQPCVQGGRCRETDTGTNEKKGANLLQKIMGTDQMDKVVPGTSKMNHQLHLHYPHDKLSPESVRDLVIRGKSPSGQEGTKIQGETKEEAQAGSQENGFNPAVDYLNHHVKIETQIPIQDGLALVPIEYPATQLQLPRSLGRNVTLFGQEGMPLIVDRIFWSKEALDLVPPGISENEFQDFLKATSREKVTVMENATWTKCGRLKNQFLQLESGRHLCARYRDQFKMIQGEVLSFYLSRFLGLDNIPPVALALVDSNASQWQDVKLKISEAGWSQNHIINQIMWIDSIGKHSHTRMPPLILKAYESNQTLTWRDKALRNLSVYQISELIQWADLVLFDYITGNYDRVASMQDGADHEKKPEIMREYMRNLPKDRAGKLWLIDNESGLLDAYHLIPVSTAKFHRFHTQMLHTSCILNKRTVSKILTLAKFPEPHKLLVNYAQKQDSLYKLFPDEHTEFTLFKKLFHTRLKDIVAWVDHCKTL